MQLLTLLVNNKKYKKKSLWVDVINIYINNVPKVSFDLVMIFIRPKAMENLGLKFVVSSNKGFLYAKPALFYALKPCCSANLFAYNKPVSVCIQ